MQFLKVQENGTAKLFFLSSALWFALGTIEGITAATQMVIPDLYGGIAGLVFSRVRPMHTTTMIFGFAGSALIGSAHYIMPAVLRTSLWSEKLGKVSLWIWNLSILTGIVALDLGYSQGREYAEWIWPANIGLLLSMALVFFNLLQTAANRQEKIMYVSTWYIFAALVYTWFIYFFGHAVFSPKRRDNRAARRNSGLVLRTRHRRPVPDAFVSGHSLLCHPESGPQSPLQPLAVSRRLLDHPGNIHPHRNASHSSDPCTGLAEDPGGIRKHRHDHPCFHGAG